MKAMNELNEKLGEFCEYKRIDEIPAKETVVISDNLNCGLFKLRGLASYIDSISLELDCIQQKTVTEGVKEITIRPKNMRQALDIINKYPSAKVIGLCTDYVIYSIYSESGYSYITESEKHGYINKLMDEPWYWNDVPDQNYEQGYYEGHYYFPYVFQWENDIFIVEHEGLNYQIKIRENASGSEWIIDNMCNDESLAAYKDEWKVEKLGDQYLLTEYLGSASQIFIPGTIDKHNVIIGSYVFSKTRHEYNEKVRNIYVGDGCLAIKSDAFANCPLLQNVRIPETVKEYGTYIFGNSNRIKSDVIVGQNLVHCGAGEYDSVYIVEDGIQNIICGAFENTKGIKTVRLPETIEKVGDLPVNVENIVFPETLKSLEGFSLYLMAIKRIDLPLGIEKIPANFIIDAPLLEELIFPETVTDIARDAFRGAKNLKKTSLISVDDVIGPILPRTIKSVGWDSFCNRIAVSDNLERFVGMRPYESILLNIYSCEDQSLSYRIWVPFDETKSELVYELTKLWKKNEGWNFTKYDELYSQYKKTENKFFHAICRLRYPVDLDAKKEKTYLRYYKSKREEVLPVLERRGFSEASKICRELDEKFGDTK